MYMLLMNLSTLGICNGSLVYLGLFLEMFCFVQHITTENIIHLSSLREVTAIDIMFESNNTPFLLTKDITPVDSKTQMWDF